MPISFIRNLVRRFPTYGRLAMIVGFFDLLLPNASAQELSPPRLKIIWHKQNGRPDSTALTDKSPEETWIRSCFQLSRALTIRKGPWGMGIFNGASCFIDDKKIVGFNDSKAWILDYLEGDQETTLQLRAGSDVDARVIATAGFKGGRSAMKFFLDKGFADLIGLRLLNQLPVMGWIPPGSLPATLEFKSRAIAVPPSAIRLYKAARPPKYLNAYIATMNDEFLFPEIVAKGKRTALVEPPPPPRSTMSGGNSAKVATAKNKQNYYVSWKFDPEIAEASQKKGLWVHDKRGPGKLLKQLDSAINQAAELIDDAIEEGLLAKFLQGVRSNVSSGYVGVRYGSQVLSRDPLLRKTAFFGLLAEVRAGPLNGLRYYWDKVPSKSQTIDGLQTNIEWSRHIIGKSFGLNLTRFVDRLDFTPKIGIWSFKARLVDSYNPNGTAATVGRFELDRSISFSFEAGAEWLRPRYTIRPWYSYDFSNATKSVSKKTVTSNRIGLDTHWISGPRFKLLGLPLRTTWMGFVIYETITLSSVNSNQAYADGEREIIGVKFSNGYAGVGVAVSW